MKWEFRILKLFPSLTFNVRNERSARSENGPRGSMWVRVDPRLHRSLPLQTCACQHSGADLSWLGADVMLPLLLKFFTRCLQVLNSYSVIPICEPILQIHVLQLKQTVGRLPRKKEKNNEWREIPSCVLTAGSFWSSSESIWLPDQRTDFFLDFFSSFEKGEIKFDPVFLT